MGFLNIVKDQENNDGKFINNQQQQGNSTFTATSMQTAQYNNQMQANNQANYQQPVQQPANPTQNSTIMQQVPVGSINNPSTIKPNLEQLANIEALDENVQKADPLENGKNEIPVNPVATGDVIDYEKYERYIISPFEFIRNLTKMIFKPGSTLIEGANKYRSLKNGILNTLFMTILTIVFCLIGSFIAAMFVKVYNSGTESFHVVFNISNITQYNYIKDVINAILANMLPIIGISLVFYLMSFLNSKGLSLGSYLAIVNYSFIPFIVCYNVLFYLISLFSATIAFALLFACGGFTLVLIIIAISESLKFDNLNIKMYYFCSSLGIIFALLFILVIYIYFDGVIPFSML